MTQAETEMIEAFKREFALALRRITGRKIDLFPEDLPTEIKDEGRTATTNNGSDACKGSAVQEGQG